MINLNKITISGFLTRNPELLNINDESSVAKTRLAYNGLPYKTREGEEKRDVLFIDLEVWGTLGKSLVKHAVKGSALLVEGELKQSFWETDEGQRRVRTFLRVIRWQFAAPKKDDSSKSKKTAKSAKKPATVKA